MNENKIRSTIKAASRLDETKWIAELIEKKLYQDENMRWEAILVIIDRPLLDFKEK